MIIPKPKNNNQTRIFSSFEDMLNQKHPLFILENKVAWNIFEEAF